MLFLFLNHSHHLWIVSTILAVALAFSLSIPEIVVSVMRRLGHNRENRVKRLIFFDRLRAPARMVLVVAAVGVLVRYFPIPPAILYPVRKLLLLTWIGCVAWFLINAVRATEELALMRFDLTVSDNLRARRVRTQMQMVRRFATALILLLALAAMLFSFHSVRAYGTGLFASAGLAGLVLATAARSTLGNLLAGLQVAIAEPIRIDDVVIVEGEWGRIEEITTTYVQVKIWDQRRMILPLTYFIEKPFQNWTRQTADLLGTVFLYVDYSVPVAEVREKFTQFITQHPLWNRKAQVTQVTDLKERTLEIRLLMSADDSGKLFDLRCAAREYMIDWLATQHPGSLPLSRVSLPETQLQVLSGQTGANMNAIEISDGSGSH